MPNLPSGTVTFAFSDIEGSTALLKGVGEEAYAGLLAIHRRLVRETFVGHGGQEIDTQGDAFFYSFVRAREAVAAAAALQRAHETESWPGGVAVRIRLGLHTGEPAVGDEGYTGLDVVRAARIAAVGRGGQVLLSETTRAIVANALPEGVELVELGQRQLKDIDQPEVLYELRIAGVALPQAPATDDAARQGPRLQLPADVPAWVRDLAAPLLPAADHTRRAIEERVLAELKDAFTAGDERRAARDAPPPPPEPPARRRSLADEIAKLQDLREAGALTDAQYQHAVDALVEDEG
jgi:class 3 adenylate cyclase